ncbi:MAG TPA: alkaline phosphatase family protein [Acidimicrobiales bacterium]|nr:alkaline phosphatase family protein [Acidimicrobiales bacterium]
MRPSAPYFVASATALLVVAALGGACGSSSSKATPSSTAHSTTTPSSAAAPVGNIYCGTKTGTPTTTKVMVIYEENSDASSIYGSSAALNMNKYAADCGSAQNYQALTHPSLPNYMASTSGVSYASDPWTSDCDPGANCLTGNDNIFHQVGASGWKAYAESMTSNCQTGSSDQYASKHNPAEYYTDVSAQCPTNDVPMGTTSSGALHDAVMGGTLPTFSTVTPNLNNDMHDGGTIPQADTWLAGWMAQIAAGPDYRSGHLVVLVVWDEGSGDGNVASTVAMIAMSPYIAAGTRSSTYFTHYSFLKAAEDVAGVSELGGAITANNLRTAFGF